jgi:hypothetical protein
MPNLSCVVAEGRGSFSGRGLPARLPGRELLTEPGIDVTALLGPGGTDCALVEICNAGIFSTVRGSTSSRLIGMPSDIRCCLRVRDLVQLTGCTWGVAEGSSTR